MRREQLQRIVNGLEEQSVLVREDRRNHVYQLSKIRNFDDVRVIDERVQEAGHYQGILQVVVFF